MLLFINVAGLAIGIATFLIISLLVIDELSCDRFNTDASQIVRVNLNAKMGKEIIAESNVMAALAAKFMKALPEVKANTRILKTAENAKAIYKNKIYRKVKSAMVDTTFLTFLK